MLEKFDKVMYDIFDILEKHKCSPIEARQYIQAIDMALFNMYNNNPEAFANSKLKDILRKDNNNEINK